MSSMSLWLFFNFVTSAISANQNNVRSSQCHSNKTNIYTLSNQCSITSTVYLQNSTLIQRSMFKNISTRLKRVFSLKKARPSSLNDRTIWTRKLLHNACTWLHPRGLGNTERLLNISQWYSKKVPFWSYKRGMVEREDGFNQRD